MRVAGECFQSFASTSNPVSVIRILFLTFLVLLSSYAPVCVGDPSTRFKLGIRTILLVKIPGHSQSFGLGGDSRAWAFPLRRHRSQARSQSIPGQRICSCGVSDARSRLRVVDFPLESNRARRSVLLGSIAIAAILAAQAAQIWLANHRIQSHDSNTIQRGVLLAPGNADAWDRLGRFRQWDLMDPDISAAILDYKNAVRHEPSSPYYWMDLASAYEDTGDIADARDAFKRAKEVYPASADVAWHRGNFLLRQQESSEGMKEIQSAVRTDASLLPQAVSRVWRSSHDVNALLDQVLQANLESYFGALDFFNSIHEADPALVIWQKLLMFEKPFPLTRSFPFIEELIREDRSDDARRVWLGALGAAGLPHEASVDESVVWDGDFTQAFPNGGLGWRWDPPLGVAIDFDGPRQSSGTRSVRLDFGGGTNLELSGPLQYVPVEPNRTYNFRGYLRTEQISTESGLRFSIADPHHPADVRAFTDNLTGTNSWTEANAQISTGPQTHFLLVRLYRYPSRLFENKLSGTAWIADVSLIPSDVQAKRPPQ
jgi:tetratricopeptide (TPR) repeat protein